MGSQHSLAINSSNVATQQQSQQQQQQQLSNNNNYKSSREDQDMSQQDTSTYTQDLNDQSYISQNRSQPATSAPDADYQQQINPVKDNQQTQFPQYSRDQQPQPQQQTFDNVRNGSQNSHDWLQNRVQSGITGSANDSDYSLQSNQQQMHPTYNQQVLTNSQKDLDQQQKSAMQVISTVFTWRHGGQRVMLAGNFTEWQQVPMQWNGQEFQLIQNLPRGVYQYKFVVDNNWCYASDEPTTRDQHGNVNNYLDTTNTMMKVPVPQQSDLDKTQQNQGYSDQQKYQSQKVQESPVKASLDPACNSGSSSSYNQEIPDHFVEKIQVIPVHFQYNFMHRDKMPVHNEKYSKRSNDFLTNDVIQKGIFDRSLSQPSHVVLNNLNCYEQTKSNQQAHMSTMSMSQRIAKDKFITGIYYKQDIIQN